MIVERLAAFAAVGAFLLAISVGLAKAVSMWRKRWKQRKRVEARLYPFFFAPAKLHGVALRVRGISDNPYEIIGAALRIKGIDLAPLMMRGWASAPELKVRESWIGKARLDIVMRWVRGNALSVNESKTNGLRLFKGHTATFFTPISGNEITKYIPMLRKSLGIVLYTTEGDKEVLSAKATFGAYRDAFKAWGGESRWILTILGRLWPKGGRHLFRCGYDKFGWVLRAYSEEI